MKTHRHDVYVYPKDENGHTSVKRRYLDHTDVYQFEAESDELLSVTKNGVKKTVRVVDSNEFAYSLQKTRIKAMDGAKGLYEFLDEHSDPGAILYCNVIKVLDYIADTMKGVA